MFTHHPVLPVHVVHYQLLHLFQGVSFYDEQRPLRVWSRLSVNCRCGFIWVSNYTSDSYSKRLFSNEWSVSAKEMNGYVLKTPLFICGFTSAR